MNKIYTKTGDKGTTTLFGGEKVPKYDKRIEAQGEIDELSCCIGMITALMPSTVLEEIQTCLFHMGATINLEEGKQIKVQLTTVTTEDVEKLEKFIDGMSSQIPELRNFILPGGDDLISRIHLARAVCRRAERRCSVLEIKDTTPIVYLNRLSDYLFTLARYISYKKDPPIPERIVRGKNT